MRASDGLYHPFVVTRPFLRSIDESVYHYFPTIVSDSTRNNYCGTSLFWIVFSDTSYLVSGFRHDLVCTRE